jgi:hypothetical protein
MKKQLTLLFLLLSIIGNSQTNYEKGYYINNKGLKIEGYIKNRDWKNSPSEISFKETEISDSQLIDITSISEFEIINFTKFKKFDVAIDHSSNNLGTLSNSKEFTYTYETLMLQVIIEGKASLYKFSSDKFFYSKEGLNIKQLAYKKHILSAEDYIKMTRSSSDSQVNTAVIENNEYKKQLFEDLSFGEETRSQITKLKYTESELKDYFILYNKASNSEYTIYKKDRKGKFNLYGVAILNNNNLDLNLNNDPYRSNKFDNSTNFGFGVELELVFPFYNNKWAAFIEPSYNSYSSSAHLKSREFFGTFHEQDVSAKINYIQTPIGGRHYMYLNDNFKLHLDLGLNISFITGEIDFEESGDIILDGSTFNIKLGAGFSYGKGSLSINYFTPQQLFNTNDTSIYNLKYNNISVNFKYNFSK